MKNGRTRDTAPYLLGRFLCSKESLDFPAITAMMISVLRYMYDVMEMNYSKTGVSVCDKSVQQISDYSRASRSQTNRLLSKAIKMELLAVESRKHRCHTRYSVGNLISLRLTQSLNESLEAHTEPQLGSHRASRTPFEAPTEPPVIKSFCNKESKKERARAALASPLSLSFEPNAKSQALCAQRNLDWKWMTEKFQAYSQASGRTYADADAAFQLFVMNEKAGLTPSLVAKPVEQTYVPPDDDYIPCDACRRPLAYCECNQPSTQETYAPFRQQLQEAIKKIAKRH